MTKDNLGKEILNREYLRKKQKNPAYSLRAFAKYLGIGIATLSDCLAAKRILSKKNILKIKEKLELSPGEIERLLREVDRSYEKSGIDIERLQLLEDQFKVISDWYHYAILELAAVSDHKAAPEWVGKKLGVSVTEVKLAMERLQRMGLLEVKNNKLSRLTPPLTTTSDVPSFALRKRHRQILDMAMDSLANDPLDIRDFRTMTMAIDPEKINEAKDLIVKSLRKICRLLESGKPKEIYSLSIELFPLRNRNE